MPTTEELASNRLTVHLYCEQASDRAVAILEDTR